MPPKAEKKNNGFDRLRADLKAQTPQNVYLFYGEETYLRLTYVEELHGTADRRRASRRSTSTGSPASRIDGAGCWSEVPVAMPMMAPQHHGGGDGSGTSSGWTRQQRTAADRPCWRTLPEYCTLVLCIYDTAAL